MFSINTSIAKQNNYYFKFKQFLKQLRMGQKFLPPFSFFTLNLKTIFQSILTFVVLKFLSNNFAILYVRYDRSCNTMIDQIDSGSHFLIIRRWIPFYFNHCAIIKTEFYYYFNSRRGCHIHFQTFILFSVVISVLITVPSIIFWDFEPLVILPVLSCCLSWWSI